MMRKFPGAGISPTVADFTWTPDGRSRGSVFRPVHERITAELRRFHGRRGGVVLRKSDSGQQDTANQRLHSMGIDAVHTGCEILFHGCSVTVVQSNIAELENHERPEHCSFFGEVMVL